MPKDKKGFIAVYNEKLTRVHQFICTPIRWFTFGSICLL